MADVYGLVLVLHVLATVVWVGGVLLVQVLATRILRGGDRNRFLAFMGEAGWASRRLFTPAGYLAGATGIFLGWRYLNDPPAWVLVGFVLWAGALAVGIVGIGPRMGRVMPRLAAGNVGGDQTRALMAPVMRLSRLGLVLMLAAMVIMTVKLPA